MKNQAQIFFGLILLLFISPIVIEILFNKPQQAVIQENVDTEEKQSVVYASTEIEDIETMEQIEPKTALILFTHSHEAFLPIVKNESGQSAVYHSTSNITQFEDIIRNHFSLNSIETEFLGVDTMDVMTKTNRTFPEAYNVIRPFLSTKVKDNKYDVIIDLHRDSATRENSTLTYNNDTFGKIYFVVGEENPNYISNKAYAQQLSSKLNDIVPGISKGVIGKKEIM